MSFRNRPGNTSTISNPREAGHFAHAAAHVLRALSARQVADCGADLLDLIVHETALESARSDRDGSQRRPTCARWPHS
jgi:hypothetical protein